MNLMTSYCSTAHTRTDTCMLIHTHTHTMRRPHDHVKDWNAEFGGLES